MNLPALRGRLVLALAPVLLSCCRPRVPQRSWRGSYRHPHIAYYAVPGNAKAVSAFRYQVTRHWHKALAAPQPEDPGQLDADALDRNPVAAARPRDASLPRSTLRRHSPKVGAQCGSPARWDLRGQADDSGGTDGRYGRTSHRDLREVRQSQAAGQMPAASQSVPPARSFTGGHRIRC